MTRSSLFALAALSAAAPATAQSPASVTLFNTGRVLVRRTLPVQLPAGQSTQPITLGLFSPESFSALDPGVSVTRITFDPATSEDALLRRNVGQSFTFEVSNGQRIASLLAVDPERWQWDGAGGVIFGRPGRIIWPKEMVPLAPTTNVSFESDRARSSVKVMYQTSGGSWGAAYRLFLGAGGRVEGVASIVGGTLDLRDAEVQLLAGNIGYAGPQPSPMARGAVMEMAAKSQALDGMSSQAIGEAHLYTLPGRVTFMPGTQLVVPLFDPAPAHAERRLTVGGGLPFYGGFGQQEDEQDVPVEVAYRMERKQGSTFGDLPLPAGAVSVFDTDRNGRVQLIGQSAINHTAPGEELVVNTGTAFDVTAKRVQTEYSTTRMAAPTRTIAMVGYRVTLQNAKDSTVVVEVREDRGGEWSVVASSVAGQKRSASRTVFPVTVPARGSAVLTYRLRVVW